MRENADQNNFEYGHFLRSVLFLKVQVSTLCFYPLIDQTFKIKSLKDKVVPQNMVVKSKLRFS